MCQGGRCLGRSVTGYGGVRGGECQGRGGSGEGSVWGLGVSRNKSVREGECQSCCLLVNLVSSQVDHTSHKFCIRKGIQPRLHLIPSTSHISKHQSKHVLNWAAYKSKLNLANCPPPHTHTDTHIHTTTSNALV